MKPNAVTITTSGDKIHITTPYNAMFTERAKHLGGRWNGTAWVFNAGTEPTVREFVLGCFGTDQPDYTSVTVRIDANKAWRQDPTGGESALYFAGRKVLDRRQRDAAIRLDDGVAVISGTLPISGGSMRYPSLALTAKDAVILEIYDVPVRHADLSNDYVEAIRPSTISRESLETERDAVTAQLTALTARLAEIDTQLAEIP